MERRGNQTPTYLRMRSIFSALSKNHHLIPGSSTTPAQVYLGNDRHRFRNRRVSSFTIFYLLLASEQVPSTFLTVIIAKYSQSRKYVALTSRHMSAFASLCPHHTTLIVYLTPRYGALVFSVSTSNAIFMLYN